MATVTPPRNRALNVSEAQAIVRHPLERIRGIIRTYVSLEGAALLFTLLALWFWVTLVLDFGPFRLGGWDWVQEVPQRGARAFSLGVFFLAAVVILRLGLIARLYGDEARKIARIGFATTAKRQTLPVWLRLPLVGAGVAVTCWAGDVLTPKGGPWVLGPVLATLVALFISGFYEMFGVTSGVSRWLRTPAAALGSAAGAFFGAAIGFALAGPVGGIILSGLLAIVGDALALVTIGIISVLLNGEGFLVALSVPAVLVYLFGWVLAGWSGELMPWFAGLLVILLMVGPVLAVVAGRLLHDFHDDAIALVLERRFPKVLGDRLITAVELANPRIADRYGYSPVMIERTILDAAERVDSVNVRDVFDWKRLALQFVGLLACTVGLYFVVMANAVVASLTPADPLFTYGLIGVFMLNVYAITAAGYLFIKHGGKAALVIVAIPAILLAAQIIHLIYLGVWLSLMSGSPGFLVLVLALVAVILAVVGLPVLLGGAYVYFKHRVWAWVDVPIVVLCLIGGVVLGTARGGVTADCAKSFNETTGLWFERDVLLQNVIWPRRAYLQVLDFEEGEKRIGRDDQALGIKVRGYKWVVADSATAEGWRALSWDDLQTNKRLLGAAPPSVNFPSEWGTPRDPKIGWSLDEIEMRLDREETHETIEPDTKDALRDVLSKLEERAADPAMRRTMRMLIVPSQITVRYWGESGRSDLTLLRQGDNEYTGQFPELKESVKFYAKGEDYYTPTYPITVVAPPSLDTLYYDEEKPAYLLYRAEGDDPNSLLGLKQRVAGQGVSTSGDTSRIEPVPAGSNLILVGKTSKPLREVEIEVRGKNAVPIDAKVEMIGPDTFQVRFDNVRSTKERPAYDFYFKFVDTDGVKGERHVVIKPHDDALPDLGIAVKVFQPTAQGYMVTPQALIPLEAKVTDPEGLRLVEYACTVTKLDRQAEQSGRALMELAAMHLLPGGPGEELVTAARIAALSREAKGGPKGGSETGVQCFPVPTFSIPPKEPLPLKTIQENLHKDRALPEATLTRSFLIEDLEKKESRNVEDAKWFFNIDQVKNADNKFLKVPPGEDIQPRYRMQLWMEAVDTDIETGKEELKTAKGNTYRGNRNRSKETVTFVVVSENELLAEVAKEEETLYVKLGEQVRKLQEGLNKLDRVKEGLTALKVDPNEFVSILARCDELAQTLEKGELSVGEVSTAYERILKVLVLNRVEPAMIERVQKQIVEPLNIAVNGNDEDRSAKDNFPKTKAGIVDLRAVASGEEDLGTKIAKTRTSTDEARLRLDALIRRLINVLDKMESLADVNKLIKTLQEIEQEESHQKDVLQKIKQKIIDDNYKALQGEKP